MAAARLLNAPVALKICSHDIPQKTEADGVRRNVRGDAEVRAQYEAIVDALSVPATSN